MKISIEKNDVINAEITKNLLPDLLIHQLFDLNSGITCLFSQMACSQASKIANPEISDDEWGQIYQVAEFQMRLQDEIRNRVPAEITEVIDSQLNEDGS